MDSPDARARDGALANAAGARRFRAARSRTTLSSVRSSRSPARGSNMERRSLALPLLLLAIVAAARADPKALKCLVCRNAITEFEAVAAKWDPARTVEVGNYRLDGSGNAVQKRVPLSRSQVKLSETLDEVCKTMSDYVRVRYKATGKYAVLKMTVGGGMNPEFSLTDFVTDEDLNKSLEFYCEEIINENEDEIIQLYADRPEEKFPDVRQTLCADSLKLCEDWMLPDELDRSWNAEEEKRRGSVNYGFNPHVEDRDEGPVENLVRDEAEL